MTKRKLEQEDVSSTEPKFRKTESSGDIAKYVSDQVKTCLVLRELSDIVADYVRPGPSGVLKNQICHLSHFPILAVSEDEKHCFTRSLFGTSISKWSTKNGKSVIIRSDALPTDFRYGMADALQESGGKLYTADVQDDFVKVKDSEDGTLILTVGKDILEKPVSLCLNISHIFVSDEKKNRISVFTKEDGVFVHHITSVHMKSPQTVCVENNELFVKTRTSMFLYVFNISTGELDRIIPLLSEDKVGTINFSGKSGFAVSGGEIFTSPIAPSGPILRSILVHSAKDGSFLRSWLTGSAYTYSLHSRNGKLWCGQFMTSSGEKAHYRIAMYE